MIVCKKDMHVGDIVDKEELRADGVRLAVQDGCSVVEATDGSCAIQIKGDADNEADFDVVMPIDLWNAVKKDKLKRMQIRKNDAKYAVNNRCVELENSAIFPNFADILKDSISKPTFMVNIRSAARMFVLLHRLVDDDNAHAEIRLTKSCAHISVPARPAIKAAMILRASDVDARSETTHTAEGAHHDVHDGEA